MTNLRNKILGTAVALGLTLGANGCSRNVYDGLTSYGKTSVYQMRLIDGTSTRVLIQKGDTTWTVHDFFTSGSILDKSDWVSVAVKGKGIQRYEQDNFYDSITNTRFYKNGSDLEKAVYAKSREILKDRFEPMYKQALREATQSAVSKVR